MLTFQAALDPHHSIFRIVRLAEGLHECLPTEIDKVRILDFYLAFPFRAEDFKFRKGQIGLKRVAKSYDKMRPYGGLPDDRDLLLRMRPVQSVAFETLAARGIIDPDAFKQQMFVAGDVPAPSSLLDRAIELNTEQHDLMEILQIICLTNPLLGSDGIKKRSGLMDYRYDSV